MLAKTPPDLIANSAGGGLQITLRHTERRKSNKKRKDIYLGWGNVGERKFLRDEITKITCKTSREKTKS